MDIDLLTDDSALQAILGRSDLVSGIDNDALDFSQLESYITENIEDGPPEFADGLSGAEAAKYSTDVEPASARSGLPSGFLSCKTGTSQPHLPDSPPDSGSEPPFSPQDHPSQLHSPHQKPLSGHLADLSESQRSFLMGGGVRAPGQAQFPGAPPMSQPQIPPPGISSQMAMSGMAPMTMTQFQPSLGQMPQAPVPAYSPVAQPAAPTKKRKLSASELLNLPIKQEPAGSRGAPPPGHPPPLPPIVNHSSMDDDDYTFDMSCSNDVTSYMDPAYQCIRFTPFQQNLWHQTCDANLKELQTPYFKVDADKGFNYSNSDEAFVCQKKNHFQITCHIHQPVSRPHYVKTADGLKKIDAFIVNFFGVKTESPNQCIKVEQSQSDRTKRCYKPVVVELNPEQTVKITVGRLHFSETTTNNMRKKGKPNPDQRFFYLVVSLQAAVGEGRHPLIQFATERIIVRASNPGQFESDVELCWQKGQTQDSTYHVGRVGVNTDKPDEALVVHGNLKLTGHVMNPSDRRVKDDIEELDTKEQLNNVQKLRVVKYNYVSEFADSVGLEDANDTGVIAQEVQSILPDAVRPAGDVMLPSGRKVDNFLVVNKERIFMENIGAVKELCKVTGTLENRIEELERMNRRLAKLKRHGSLKSTSSVSTVTSLASSYLSSSHFHKRKPKPPPGILHNKLVQGGVCVLVLLMLFCSIAMATLYSIEWQKRQDLLANFTKPSVESEKNHHLDNAHQTRPLLGGNFSVNGSTLEPLPPQGRIASTGVPYSLVPPTTIAPPPPPPPPQPLSPKEDRTVAEEVTALPLDVLDRETRPPQLSAVLSGVPSGTGTEAPTKRSSTAATTSATPPTTSTTTAAPTTAETVTTTSAATSTTTTAGNSTTTTPRTSTLKRLTSGLMTSKQDSNVNGSTASSPTEGSPITIGSSETTASERPSLADATSSTSTTTTTTTTSTATTTTPTTTPTTTTPAPETTSSSTTTTTTTTTATTSTSTAPPTAPSTTSSTSPSPATVPNEVAAELPTTTEAPQSELEATTADSGRRPPVIGADESCRAGQDDTCRIICCLASPLSETDRSVLSDSAAQNTSSVTAEDLNSTRLEPSSGLSDVQGNQIGYSASSGQDTPVGKRDSSQFQSEEEIRASSRYSGTRRMRYPVRPIDTTMANDALSGTMNDWSKRKQEKKTTPATRDWRLRRGHRRRGRTGRSASSGFGYIEHLRLREYPDIRIDQRFCARDVPSYENCINNVGGNFTFYIPVSKHMTRQMLHLQLHYSEQHALAPAPVQCRSQLQELPQACVEQSAGDQRRRLQQPTRSGSQGGKPIFLIPLDAGRWRFKSYTFRIAAEYFPGLDPCRVSRTFIKTHFYEYNVIFERQCSD